MVCTHVPAITAQTELKRLAKAAEAIFAAGNRPVLGLGIEAILRCCHSGCLFSSSQGVYVCIQCTHVSCRHLGTQRRMKCATDKGTREDIISPSHLGLHFLKSGHLLFLSVEHMHLYCAKCDDFVFDRYLDPIIATKARAARARRSRFISSTSPLEAKVQRTISVEESLILRMQKRRRLVTPENWTPSKNEIKSISKHSTVLSLPEAELRPPIGLANLGNSCYMNSVLQAFLNAPPLRNFFLADQHRAICKKREGPGCLACAIDRLVCDSCFGMNSAIGKGREDPSSSMKVPFVVPHDILDIMWRNASHLATYAQHDAHEFLIAALNVLNTHCRIDKVEGDPRMECYGSVVRHESDTERIASGTRFHSNLARRVSPISPITNVRAEQGGNFLGQGVSAGQATASIIQSLFSGTLQSDVICRVCGNSSLTLEKFYDISLDVDKFVKGSSTRLSRAQSPASGNPNTEGQHTSICASGANPDLLHDDQDGIRVKEDSKELSNLEDPKSATGPPAEPTNGNSDSHQLGDFDAANSLEECLSRFTEPEILGPSSKMHCTKCGTRQESMKQMSIRTLPPIICFHFKRFEQSFANIRRSEMIKIDTPVEFPADGMDLSKFQTTSVLIKRQKSKTLLHSDTVHSALLAAVKAKMNNGSYDISVEDKSKEEVRSNKEAIYDLFAVVNHNGRIDSGHYTAMVRKKGAWFKCDDEKVAMLPAVDEVIRSEEAYLVFYQQRYPNIQVSDSWDC